jgi:mannosyltransferase
VNHRARYARLDLPIATRAREMLRRRGPRRRPPLWLLLACLAPFILEVLIHRRQYAVPRPDHELDTPFYTSCQEPDTSQKRENAALVMLTRNSELEKANHTVASIERHFNRWFNYPIVFLNDEPWDPRFIEVLNASVSGEARFEVIPRREWTFPADIDIEAARDSIREQEEEGVMYGGLEGYHHMCRFYSG